MKDCDVALTVAEDDGVLDVLAADELAKLLALGPGLAIAAVDEALGDGLRCRCRLCHFDSRGVDEEVVHQPLDLRWHGC